MSRLFKEKNMGKNPPIFNLPPYIKYLALILVLIHIIRFALPASVDNVIVGHFAFSPIRVILDGNFFQWLALPISMFSYQFLHGGWTHLIMNTLFMIAIGAGVEYRLGGKKMLLFFIVCGVVAAFVELAVAVAFGDYGKIIVGASGSISGLFAGVLWFQARIRAPWDPKKQMMKFGLIFSAFFIVVGVLFPGGDIAWVAHLGGFWAGIFLFPYFEKPWTPNKKKKSHLHVVH